MPRSTHTARLAALIALSGSALVASAQTNLVQAQAGDQQAGQAGARAAVADPGTPVMDLRTPGRVTTWAVTNPEAKTSAMSFLADGEIVGAPNAYTATSEVHVVGIPAEELGAMPGVLAVRSPGYAPQLVMVELATVKAAAQFADAIASDARAKIVEHAIETPRVTLGGLPSDPGFGNQWHLRNTSVTVADANVEPAWNAGFTGNGVTIGIIEGGFQSTHPDLSPNYNSAISLPTGQVTSHATSVAGVAGARGNNGLGGVGSAYGAELADVSWNNPPAALTHQFNNIDIYNSSWGRGDDIAMWNLSTNERLALKDGWENGRNGLGSIYVWAAGNGGSNDRVDYGGWSSSRYTFGIGAIGDLDRRANYNELGSSMLAVAHSSGNNRGVYTTRPTNGYTSSFGGTSSAAPLAAGIFALVLEANPTITARDLKHLVVNTARKNDPSNSGWTVNAAGHEFNDNYGFGALDAEALVNAALTWENVGPETEIPSAWTDISVPVPDSDPFWTSVEVQIDENIQIENVELLLRVTVADEDNIELDLVSPSGTVSPLMRSTTTSGRNSNANNIDHRFTSNRFWDEESQGTWTIRVRDLISGPAASPGATITRYRLRIHGRDLVNACAADFNADGSVNVLDVVAFINNWNTQGAGSDFNNDGSVNVLDVVAFINTWNAGCA